MKTDRTDPPVLTPEALQVVVYGAQEKYREARVASKLQEEQVLKLEQEKEGLESRLMKAKISLVELKIEEKARERVLSLLSNCNFTPGK